MIFFKLNIVFVEGNIDILYEDNFFLFVNKFFGFFLYLFKGYYFDIIVNYVEYYLNFKNFILYIINRLDKDILGIVVFVKNFYFYSIVLYEFEKR